MVSLVFLIISLFINLGIFCVKLVYSIIKTIVILIKELVTWIMDKTYDRRQEKKEKKLWKSIIRWDKNIIDIHEIK